MIKSFILVFENSWTIQVKACSCVVDFFQHFLCCYWQTRENYLCFRRAQLLSTLLIVTFLLQLSEIFSTKITAVNLACAMGQPSNEDFATERQTRLFQLRFDIQCCRYTQTWFKTMTLQKSRGVFRGGHWAMAPPLLVQKV